MLHFSNPWFLLLLLLVPLLVVVWVWRQKRPATMQYSDLSLLSNLPVSARLYFRWILPLLRALVIILLILAVARPQTSHEVETVYGKGVDIVLAVDISPSMAALDFEPKNRLEAAKDVIDDFIAERRYDRIGMVVFSGEAFSQCPPTFDYDVLHQLVSELKLGVDMGLEGGTAIGLGLAQAASMLQKSDAKSRIIILLTDGVNNSGQIDPLTAARAAAALNIKVYTIGVGIPGILVPFPLENQFFGNSTQMVESELDETTLQKIAEMTSAKYYRATDSQGLRQIYDQINRMEKSDVQVQIFTRYKEWSGFALLPALFLLLLERVLQYTVFRNIP